MARRNLSLNEIAYLEIKEKIINGEFEPGSRIREDHLADEISMSRTPVREAINRLVSDGLIINKARKGLYLINPTNEEMEHFLDIRIVLEKLAITKCIEHVTAEGLEEIQQNLDQFSSTCDAGEYELCNKLDGEFHLLVAKHSGNMKLYTMLNDISTFFLQTRYWEKKIHPKTKNEKTLREHREILEAIKRHDISAAVNAISRNINTMRDKLQHREDPAETLSAE